MYFEWINALISIIRVFVTIPIHDFNINVSVPLAVSKLNTDMGF